MSEIADRWRRVADEFTRCARTVPDGAWERPAPCDGWVARDVVRHLVEWVPAFFRDAGGPSFPSGSADDDPVGGWCELDGAVRAVLDDPEASAEVITHPRAGQHRVDDALDTFVLGDVLVHTWDLARATGRDVTLDPAEVKRMIDGMEPFDEMLRSSGHYGPRVPVPDDADDQTRLLAFTGRQP